MFTLFFFFFLKENEDEQAPSQGGGQTPGPQRPRSNSGRELTDEVSLNLPPFPNFLHTYIHHMCTCVLS